MKNDVTIKKALFSLWDKTGSEELASALIQNGAKIIASSGTAEYLRSKDIELEEVADITGYGEMLDGSVKTLHPKIFAGILADRENEEHIKHISEAEIEEIDLIAVNFYPFEEFVNSGDKPLADAIEMIDIGGPSMLRASAKNYSSVVAVCEPEQFKMLSEELNSTGGRVSSESRTKLAKEAFAYTSRYEAAINNYFQRNGEAGIKAINISMNKISDLRYGENPHQDAEWYSSPQFESIEIELLHGKPLSYNNLLDVDSAIGILSDIKDNGVAILKHGNPCGCSEKSSIIDSYNRALKTDPISAFGSVVGIKGEVDAPTAELLSKNFVECIVASGYAPDAFEILSKKKNLRLLSAEDFEGPDREVRALRIGLLTQDRDKKGLDITAAKVMTERKPSESELKALSIAWRIAKHVKSNAIVYCDEDGTLGIGAGQMSRVDSTRLGAMKAKAAGLTLVGSVAASDAFFPFRDSLDNIAEVGTTAVVQPGGSIRDDEVIEAANEHNMAMIFTGFRHFRH